MFYTMYIAIQVFYICSILKVNITSMLLIDNQMISLKVTSGWNDWWRMGGIDILIDCTNLLCSSKLYEFL